MATAVPASLILEEFLEQPETKPAREFIDGQVFQKLMPQGKHSRLQKSSANPQTSLFGANCGSGFPMVES